jgi:hypothetical protein
MVLAAIFVGSLLVDAKEPKGVAGAAGMTIFSEQDGQLISEPDPVLSTASSCSHFGQLKMMSIKNPVGYFGESSLCTQRNRDQKKVLTIITHAVAISDQRFAREPCARD